MKLEIYNITLCNAYRFLSKSWVMRSIFVKKLTWNLHNFYFPTPFSIFVKNELTSRGTVFKVSVSQKLSQIQEEEEEEEEEEKRNIK